MKPAAAPVQALRWRDGLELLDQELLPREERWLEVPDVEALVVAIRRLAVRGAPALGCAAAYGCVVAVRGARDAEAWRSALEDGAKRIAAARPTAVNLAHGAEHMLAAGRGLSVDAGSAAEVQAWTEALLAEAIAYHDEDRALCQAIAEHGQALLHDGMGVLTHCNAGALATGGLGTALAPLHLAASRGMTLRAYADETRPLRQGARLTAWELVRSGIPVQVLCDGAAAGLLASGSVDLVIVGSDRIARNGDVANKVGTYALALAARAHAVPFWVAAPSTTYDAGCADGAAIPIEQRDAAEVLGEDSAPGAGAWNPAFDVTPAALVSGWLTERGLHRSPTELQAAMSDAQSPSAG